MMAAESRSLTEIDRVADTTSPVRPIPTDPEEVEGKLDPGMALCLSGGGYRAMLFHLGSLWRLNEFGLLPHLDRVSSVSGGSITAATLALAWNELSFDEEGVAHNFPEKVAVPVRRLAGKTVDLWAG